ncbi:hypothetical protein APHAL10511_008652, partial [Amanita phalloides]
QSSRIENKIPGNGDILGYARAAVHHVCKAGDILEIIVKEKLMVPKKQAQEKHDRLNDQVKQPKIEEDE